MSSKKTEHKKPVENAEKIRPYKVYAIDEGVVIDHIPARKAFDVVNVLGVVDGESIVTMGVNMESEMLGRKDVVKIERKKLSREELNKVALIAPKATINLIKNHKVYEKVKIEIPAVFEGIISCQNPNCITKHQPVESKFHTVKEEPMELKCHFCERVFERDEVRLV